MFLDEMRKIKKDLIENTKKPRKNVFEIFKNNEINIISEIKKASPSKGDINKNADIVKIAGEYIKNGARAISVLTETQYFKGNIEDLKLIRKNYPEAVILRKDFILDEFQLYEAKIFGADMVLIILAFLSDDEAKKLIKKAFELGLEVLVEVHNEAEIKKALELNVNFIGVNNRNLKTLEVSLDVSRNLAKYITKDKIFVCESGITGADEIKEMKALGFSAFLIGSRFMEAGNSGEELKKIINGAKN